MTALRFSSGDPAADRRADYAEHYAASGDFAAAIEVLSGALELVPGWSAGWFRLGELFERAGRMNEAVSAWERTLALDPADALGASLKLDLARAEPLSESMPAAFVEALFDQYAPRFDAALRDRLNYRGPDLLLQALMENGVSRAGRALDLGCGTGLMGEVLRPHCGWLEGADISAGMLAAARAKNIYDALLKQDIARVAPAAHPYDLIVAADVFAYVGALEGVVSWCRASLAEGGVLAFTVEAAHAGEAPVVLRESRRFAHRQDYLDALLAGAGFGHVEIRPCVVRQDRGADIASLCVVAALTPVRHDREGDGEACIQA